MEEDFSRIVQPKTVKRFKKNIILVEYDLIFVLKEGNMNISNGRQPLKK